MQREIYEELIEWTLEKRKSSTIWKAGVISGIISCMRIDADTKDMMSEEEWELYCKNYALKLRRK